MVVPIAQTGEARRWRTTQNHRPRTTEAVAVPVANRGSSLAAAVAWPCCMMAAQMPFLFLQIATFHPPRRRVQTYTNGTA